jgi:hypothetical protein
MKLVVKPRLTKKSFTMGSVIKMGNHIGNNFQLYWVHHFSPIAPKSDKTTTEKKPGAV